VERIAIGSDHGGFRLKEEVKAYLVKQGYTVQDMGTSTEESVDYPDFAAAVARAVQQKRVELGILICGTGIGMAITANKFRGIRAAVVHDAYTAAMSRRHNDANVITFGGRVVGAGVAFSIVDAWLGNRFEGGRHSRRLDKIRVFEREMD
jgi:ribose 5-phosphate isomerase B